MLSICSLVNYLIFNSFQDDDAGDRIHMQDRESVKQLIVNLMLHSPEAIQKQLSDAVSIIGRYDFPNKWPDLISQMVEKFATGTCMSLPLDLNRQNHKLLH